MELTEFLLTLEPSDSTERVIDGDGIFICRDKMPRRIVNLVDKEKIRELDFIFSEEKFKHLWLKPAPEKLKRRFSLPTRSMGTDYGNIVEVMAKKRLIDASLEFNAVESSRNQLAEELRGVMKKYHSLICLLNKANDQLSAYSLPSLESLKQDYHAIKKIEDSGFFKILEVVADGKEVIFCTTNDVICRGFIPGQGHIEHNFGVIVFVYRISLGRIDCLANSGIGNYFVVHCFISSDGAVCFGDKAEVVSDLLSRCDFVSAFSILQNLLTSYQDGANPYATLKDYKKGEGNFQHRRDSFFAWDYKPNTVFSCDDIITSRSYSGAPSVSRRGLDGLFIAYNGTAFKLVKKMSTYWLVMRDIILDGSFLANDNEEPSDALKKRIECDLVDADCASWHDNSVLGSSWKIYDFSNEDFWIEKCKEIEDSENNDDEGDDDESDD